MIEYVSVENPSGESLQMYLTRPEKSGFVITNIDGIGPADADINTTALANDDGSVFNIARVKERNIVMTLKFMDSGDTKVEDLRRELYKYFPMKKEITLTFKTERRIVFIKGYVESNTQKTFSSKKNDASAQISILCPNPFFYSKDGTTLLSGIVAEFEFPFESVYTEFIEFSRINTKEGVNVQYDGDADTGLKIYAYARSHVEGLIIYNLNTREKIQFIDEKILEATGDYIRNKDLITIDTNKGQKSISLLRDGVRYNLLNCITKDSVFFSITKGDNLLAYLADEDYAAFLQFRIENKRLYEGI